ncbi:MAG: glycosyltransferase family 2 protein [Chloroflexota bacterium]|nr:glycosyltransferase family 2 protein [Chloroflexota bacterium]
MIRLLFWSALAAIAYTYVVFPALVFARAALRPRPPRAAPIEPSISVVMAAHNEEAAIGGRLDNLVAVDYPADRLEIIVASDGSDDATVEIAGRYRANGVRVLALGRVGKAEALNAAVSEARGDILVFTDANTMFERAALRALVAPFADPEVGGTAGDQRYLPATDQVSEAGGERSYWDFDRRIKLAESTAGSTVAATGAIYAIRRELFEPVRAGVTDDFITSTGVVARGRRLVFVADAAAWEPVAATNRLEYRRKVRIMTRGLRGVAARRALLDPRTTGFYAIQLASHKILRRLMAVPLLVVAVGAPLLWGQGAFYQLATIGAAGVAGLGAIGLGAPRSRLGRHRLVALAAFFLLVNVASLEAAWNLLTGRRIDRWEPRRAVGPEATGGAPAVPPEPVDVVSAG